MVERYNNKIFCALFLIVIAIIIFIRIHGTENLVITKIIRQYYPNFYIIKPAQINNKFIKNYLVDILWFSSFLLFTSLLEKSFYYYVAFIIAILLEILQFFCKNLGTFDLWDIFVYFVLFIIVMVFKKHKHLRS